MIGIQASISMYVEGHVKQDMLSLQGRHDAYNLLDEREYCCAGAVAPPCSMFSRLLLGWNRHISGSSVG